MLSVFRNRVPLLLGVAVAAGCRSESGSGWSGTIDTLPSGMVVVHNPAQGLWDSTSQWRITVETRIGSVEGAGPDAFGSVTAVELDKLGRIWVLDGHAQEIRVFGSDGAWVRTIGSRGGGPGEFAQAIGMAWSPAGHLWVLDPRNNRISVLDTNGTYLTSHSVPGGYVISPWPGGFDDAGSFYNVARDRAIGPFGSAFVKFDTSLTPLDTIYRPRWQGPEESFELVSSDGQSSMRAGVPFTPGLESRLTRTGNLWFAHTGSYELFHRTAEGDTLFMATKPFELFPVTEEEKDEAIGGLAWFTSQGGRVLRSRIPDVHPAIESIHVADDGTLWVEPARPRGQQAASRFDIFGSDGRFLGELDAGFSVAPHPYPVIRDGTMLAVSRDELGVHYVVLARIEGYARSR